MADSDPNRPQDYGERLRNHIHDEINARMDEKFARRRARMERRMNRWEHRRPHSPFGAAMIGTILAGVGIILLLDNLGFTVVDRIWDWWPAILILFGGARVVSSFGWGGRIWGAAILFAGTILLLHNLGYIHGNPWEYFWPVILIVIGLGMLTRALDRGGDTFVWWPPRPVVSAGAATADTIAEWAIFGGVRRRIESQNFQGGEALAMFGGINLDFTKAGIQQEEVRVEANAMFGGIDIRVPDSWQVVVRGMGIFGGYEDKTWHTPSTAGASGTEDKRPRLLITGFAVFGGVSVKTI